MKLGELAKRLDLTNLMPELDAAGREISRGYVSDLLSDVLANAPAGGVLVTVQVHLNVIAVAMHAELAAILFAADRRPEAPVRQKALEEGVALFTSPLPAWELVGHLYAAGVTGKPA